MKIKDLNAWQRGKLLTGFLCIVITGCAFLGYVGNSLYQDKMSEEAYWNLNLSQGEVLTEKVDALSTEATAVTVGTYIEDLKEINLKSNYFRLVTQIWFRWDGDNDLNMMDNFRVYKGTINKKEVIKDYHEGTVNYQLIRCDISVSKSFWTRRFPLESHQLRFYLESDIPVQKVVFKGDHQNSGLNPSLSIAGFELRKHDTAVYSIEYDNAHSDPEFTDTVINSEFVTAMEINRNGMGLYVKCFIALVGTTLWVLIVLFLNTYHHIDPLSMIPAALFGTVSNIMVGANLLPDALDLGLLEYVNAWGIMTIIVCALSVINVNRIRSKYKDNEFAGFFGRVMFYTVLTFILAGHIVMPVCAYMF